MGGQHDGLHGAEAAAAGGPSRKGLAAGHRAAEDDRVWFDKHPGVSVRVREALPGEHDEHLITHGQEPLGPDQRLAVVVLQAAPGRRIRVPFGVVLPDTPGAPLTPQQLKDVQVAWENSDQTALVTNAKGQRVDALAALRSALDTLPPQATPESSLTVAAGP
ncbi:hypothetical protein OTB20_32915 [Streptomyces sp. H27-H1]|uniref:hypothetical protein n=1 Tax=Streptomyces sp. H27-H1 TaxID=2996461 RepID=UPI00226D5071|nr:hypothetical protein [Streptomyces sp. H27-H1]MCY0930912.1 hypothetical protein [Streptomyces sp. H27-H1]